MPPFELLAGAGALAIAASVGVAALWRQHVKDDVHRDAQHDASVAWERNRTKSAEDRLDKLGGTVERAADVMERSVAVTEKALEAIREWRKAG